MLQNVVLCSAGGWVLWKSVNVVSLRLPLNLTDVDASGESLTSQWPKESNKLLLSRHLCFFIYAKIEVTLICFVVFKLSVCSYSAAVADAIAVSF